MTKEKSPLRQKDIRQGEKQERERILALPFVHELFAGEHPEDCNTCYNIALIRGDYDA